MKKEYPDESDLKLIREWDFNNFSGLIEFILSLWWMDYGVRWTKKVNRDQYGHRYYVLRISTGGWSGNEAIIDALCRNMFWSVCFYSHFRGGHYVFRIPVNLINIK